MKPLYSARMKAMAAALLALTALIAALSTAGAQVPQQPGGSIAIVNKSQGLLTVLNLQDRSHRVFKVGFLPHETVHAQGLVFVSNYGSDHVRSSDLDNEPGNTLSVIDLSRPNQPPKTVDLGAGRCAPHGLAVSPNERHLYVTCEGRQEVLVIDVATQTVRHSVSTNQAGSHMIVVSSDESKAYVANFWHGTVSVLDLKGRTILGQVETGRGTEGIGLSPDDRYLYTTSVLTNELVKVDTTTLTVIARKFIGENTAPIRVVSTPDNGKTLVINCAGDGRLLIVNAETLDVVHDVKVGNLPIGIAVPNSRYAYSANMDDGTISVTNIQAGIVEATIPAGEQPDGIAHIPQRQAGLGD